MKEQLLNVLQEIRPDVDFEHETRLIDDGILEKIDASFEEALKDEAFLDFCATKGFDVTGMSRQDAAEYVNGLQFVVAWTLYDAGVAKVSPEEFDIPRP